MSHLETEDHEPCKEDDERLVASSHFFPPLIVIGCVSAPAVNTGCPGSPATARSGPDFIRYTDVPETVPGIVFADS